MEVIGIDIGGTKMNAALVREGQVVNKAKIKVSAGGSKESVLEQLYGLIDKLITDETQGIGIGVPSVVDEDQGIVYETQNIPAWDEVPIKSLLEKKYGLKTLVNNDVNCFVLGEKYYGVGKEYSSFVGLAIGTGLGMGMVIDGKLHKGMFCGAGEIGMIPYNGGIMENYTSGLYFINYLGKTGEEVREAALQNQDWALEAFNEFGRNLGNAISTIMYLIAPEVIIIGGSVAGSYDLFEHEMKSKLETFTFKKQLHNTKIMLSNEPNIITLGAAALHKE